MYFLLICCFCVLSALASLHPGKACASPTIDCGSSSYAKDNGTGLTGDWFCSPSSCTGMSSANNKQWKGINSNFCAQNYVCCININAKPSITNTTSTTGSTQPTQPISNCPGWNNNRQVCQSIAKNNGNCPDNTTYVPSGDSYCNDKGGGGSFLCCVPGITPTPTPLPPNPCPDAPTPGVCQSINTALGVIDVNTPGAFVKTAFAVLLSLSGGIAMLLIIISGYRIMTAQGDPEKVKAAREMLTSAIIGLLFMIFSVSILQILGVDILHLPGFTGK